MKRQKLKKGRITGSTVTPSYGGFRRPDLNTAASSARRIFLRKAKAIFQGRSRSGAWNRQCENSKKAKKKASHFERSIARMLIFLSSLASNTTLVVTSSLRFTSLRSYARLPQNSLASLTHLQPLQTFLSRQGLLKHLRS